MQIVPTLDRNVLQSLQNMLNRVNLLVRVLRKVAQLPNIGEGCLKIIKDSSNDQNVYNLPTGDQIAAVWVERSIPDKMDRHTLIHPFGGPPELIDDTKCLMTLWHTRSFSRLSRMGGISTYVPRVAGRVADNV